MRPSGTSVYGGTPSERQRYSGAPNGLDLVWNPTTVLYPTTSAGNPFAAESLFRELGLFPQGSGPLPSLQGSKFTGRICGFSGELQKCLKLKVLTDACSKVYGCVWGSAFKGARARNANWFSPRDSLTALERSPALTPFREGQSRSLWYVRCGRFSGHRGLSFLTPQSVRGCSAPIYVSSHFASDSRSPKSDYRNASRARRGA